MVEALMSKMEFVWYHLLFLFLVANADEAWTSALKTPPLPEGCLRDEDCPLDKICVANRCVDPCCEPVCGLSACCRALNHRAVCECVDGDPQHSCYRDQSSSSQTFLRVCYYNSDSVNFTPDKIDVSLCTHILFAFARIRNTTLVPQKTEDIQLYEKLVDLKKQDPDLKVMLSVGGANGESGYREMVRDQRNRTRFINQSVEFLTRFGFDGVDFDWEFPGYGDDPISDRDDFNEFLKELSPVLKSRKMLVSVAVAAVLPIIYISYRIPEMAENVDFINLMSYDFHYYLNYFPFTGHNSPLYSRQHEVIILKNLNTAWAAECWVREGMPKSKIMVGIPTYGHTYTLVKADQHDLAAASTGVGQGKGWTNYPQVCKMIKSGGTRVFDKESMVPYIYEDLDWRSYDDIASVTLKSKWILEQGYGGAMVYNLNSDDWNATCDDHKKFPLTAAIRDTFHSYTMNN